MEIKIEIEDDNVFTHAAFILDQDYLYNKILEIRKCWYLDKELVFYNDFKRWIKEPHYDFSLTPEVATFWDKAKSKLPDFSFTHIESNINTEIFQEIINSDPMDLEIEYLLRKSGLPVPYKQLILKAIVCGQVAQDDWKSTKENKDFYHKDWWFDIPTYEKTYKGRPKEEIRRDRIWHWQKNKGKTQLQIAKDATERGNIDPEDYVDNVKKGLKRYRQFLKSRDMK